MDFDTVFLWVYLIYLLFPFYFGSRISAKILVQQRNVTIAASVGIILNLMLYIVAVILWLLFFSVYSGLTAEAFIEGIVFSIIAFIMSILIMSVTLMYRRAKLDKH